MFERLFRSGKIRRTNIIGVRIAFDGPAILEWTKDRKPIGCDNPVNHSAAGIGVTQHLIQILPTTPPLIFHPELTEMATGIDGSEVVKSGNASGVIYWHWKESAFVIAVDDMDSLNQRENVFGCPVAEFARITGGDTPRREMAEGVDMAEGIDRVVRGVEVPGISDVEYAPEIMASRLGSSITYANNVAAINVFLYPHSDVKAY